MAVGRADLRDYSALRLQHSLTAFGGTTGSRLCGNRAHFLSLSADIADLFAPKGYVRRHDVGKGLGSSKVRRKIEAGIDVTLRNVDDPTVEHRSAPTSRAEGFLPALKYGLDSVLGAL